MSKFNGIKSAEFILEELKKAGADKASASVNKSIKNEMNIDSGKLSLYRSTADISASMVFHY